MRRIVFGLLVLAFGVMLLLKAAGVCEFAWLSGKQWTSFILPVLVIIIGLGIIIPGRPHRDGFVTKDLPSIMEGERLHLSANYAGYEYVFDGEVFSSARLDASLGGLRLDLRKAVIKDNAKIEIHTFLGGVELLVPEDIIIETESHSFIGGIGNHHSGIGGTTVLCIKADNFIGGIDIKNKL